MALSIVVLKFSGWLAQLFGTASSGSSQYDLTDPCGWQRLDQSQLVIDSRSVVSNSLAFQRWF
jgi:hypothetical protein